MHTAVIAGARLRFDLRADSIYNVSAPWAR